jgi:drug/metabolite transporter (DMT)-like permease
MNRAAVDNKTAALAWPYLLLSVSSLSWAGNFVVGRFIHAQIPPVTLSLSRWLVALSALLPFTLRLTWEQRALIRQHWRLLATLGATGIALFHTFVYRALHYTEAVNAALILSTTPVVIAALSWTLFGDRLSRRQAFGIATSLAGALVIITRGDLRGLLHLRFNVGDLWMLMAMPNWALYSVLLRRLPGGFHPLSLLTATALFGVAFLIPLYGWELLHGERTEFGISTVSAILYIALFASVLAYVCWNRGVALVGPNRAGLFLHLIPLFSAVLAAGTLGEPVRAFHLVGAGCIFTGIYLVTRAPAAL